MSSLVKIASALVASSLAAMVGTGCISQPDDETRSADEALLGADPTLGLDQGQAPVGQGLGQAPVGQAPIGQAPVQYGAPMQGETLPVQSPVQSNLQGASNLQGGYGGMGGLGYGGLGGIGYGGLGGIGYGGFGGIGCGGLGGWGGWGGGIGCGGLGGWGGWGGGCGGLGGWGGWGGGCGGLGGWGGGFGGCW